MILDCTQYRFFNADPNIDTLRRFLLLVPAAGKIIGAEDRPRRMFLVDRSNTIDQEMFCHELAHCMDLFAKGRPESLLLENFGWPRITASKWSLKMAENECRVFTYQWLLQKELGYSIYHGLLDPLSVSHFLEQMVHRTHSKQYFLELYGPLREDLGSTFKETLNKTIDYIVAAVDKERITV